MILDSKIQGKLVGSDLDATFLDFANLTNISNRLVPGAERTDPGPTEQIGADEGTRYFLIKTSIKTASASVLPKIEQLIHH